ncbi:MAG TPA: transposase, partial [Flavobacterium sp.]|nr:transposase [Flavobacterium sp.]
RKIDRTKKGIQNLLDRYFPEYYNVFRKLDGKASLATLTYFPFPEDIKKLTTEEVIQFWRRTVQRGLGKKRAEKLIQAARNSIGITEGLDSARWELAGLLEEWDHYYRKRDELELKLEEYLMEIPYGSNLLSVPGIGPVTVGGFLAETGDLSRYQHCRQIQKLAGLNLKENSSGNRRGMTTITKRGRPKLRALLYKASMLLVANNPEFKALHYHFTHRPERPLKGKQSLTAICVKLIRVLFTLGKKGVSYIPDKMLGEFRLEQISLAA